MARFYTGMGYTADDPGEALASAFKQSRLGRLLGDYYSGGQPDLGQIARLDPESASRIKSEQDRKGLAALFGDAYAAPEDQRQGYIQKLIAADPSLGIQAAKMFDPRFASATNGIPSELQTFQAMTKGMPEDDVMTARRIALGLDPRKSSAAIGYQKVVGADGRERLMAVDPRQVGAVDLSSGQAFGSGVGQGQGVAAMPTRNDMEADIALANQMVAAGIPAEQVDAFIAARGQRANAPGANAAGGPQFASQTPGEKAYETEDATQRAKLAYLPRVGEIEAGNAGLKATEEARAKAGVEQTLKLSVRARDDREQLMLLSEAAGLLKSATSGGAAELGRDTARYFGITTEGAKADAKLETIAGKLTGKVPRFEGPQSNIDVQLYQKMAGDLANSKKTRGERIAAAQGMIDLIKKYQDYAARKSAPATGGFRILPD